MIIPFIEVTEPGEDLFNENKIKYNKQKHNLANIGILYAVIITLFSEMQVRIEMLLSMSHVNGDTSSSSACNLHNPFKFPDIYLPICVLQFGL